MSVLKEIPSSLNTYDADLSAWAERQTALLRERRSDRLDWDNIAEEIESLGKSEVNELESRLAVLLEHLIKLHMACATIRALVGNGPFWNNAKGSHVY